MRFFFVGSLRGLTRAQLREVLGSRGHCQTSSLKAADRVVLANEAVAHCLDDHGSPTAPLDSRADSLISESAFRRLLGLAEPSAAPAFTTEVAAKVCGLRPEAMRALQLADIISSGDGLSFSDLAITRRVGTWVRRGFSIPQIIAAHHVTSRGDVPIADADIELLPFGEVGLRRGESISRRGQIELILDETGARTPELFEAARLAEVEGELEDSARLYEAVLRIDEHDAESAFNLGNVLDAKGQIAHAKIAYLRAIQADPSSSDAWCNLGVLAEQEGRRLDAEHFYGSALQHDERHTNALWNLARLLCDQQRLREALPLWERLAGISAEDRAEALMWSKVCRLEAARLSRST